MYSPNTTAPMTGQAETMEPDEAMRLETIAEGAQNQATVAYALNPTRDTLDRLYRATIDHGQAVMRLIRSIERRKQAA